MISDDDYDLYDPPGVFWQTDQLYRVEHARRALKAVRQRAAADWALHNRYEEEARMRAAALAVAQMERMARREPRAWSEARWEAYREQERVAAEKRKQTLERFGTLEARNRWIYLQKLEGRTFKEIGGEVALSGVRIAQICHKQARLDEAARRRAAKRWLRPNPGRPIDMGGPREVWLTFMPSPDPRLDNMEPVRA